MKKIIFVIKSLNTGGIERALVNQIDSLDKSQYQITLFVFAKEGTLLNDLSDDINIIHGSTILNCLSMSKDESKKFVYSFFLRNFLAVVAKMIGSRKLYAWTFRNIRIDEEYDCAISYQNDLDNHSLYYGCNLFVLNNISATKKIAWLHSDFEFINRTSRIDVDLLKQFDVIVNVSETMKKNFDQQFIVQEGKSKVVYNPIPIEKIKDRANSQQFYVDNAIFSIATVCRMDRMKSVLQLIKVAQKLKYRGKKFVWLFLGTGPELKNCIKYVKKNKLNDCVKLLGEISNPFPIIKNVNLVVSGSVRETFGLSIAEALVLNTPVIALWYDAIEEVLQNNKNGIVVNNFDEMSEEICKLLDDADYYKNNKCISALLKDYNSLNCIQFKEILES